MFRQQGKLLLLVICCTASSYSMNLLRPYDTLLRPYYTSDTKYQFSFFFERGLNDRAFDVCGCTNVLRIYNPEQNALTMLDGFPASSAIGQKRIEIDASNDGIRGHILPCGTLSLDFAFAGAFRYFFLCDWSISAYMTAYSMRLHDVSWVDQTPSDDLQDIRVHELLTDNLAQNIYELGGLYIGPWKRTGPGDLTIFLDWFRDFPQNKPLLKNVRVNWRVGLMFPTGLRENENLIMAVPYGLDGAVGLPFGIGLDFNFIMCAKVGFDVQLTQVFGHTRCRRIKTALNQTDLFLLAKVPAYKDAGLIQRFNIYGQLFEFYQGLSLKVGYQFLKQNDSSFSLYGNGFSSEIANTAQFLQDWTSHIAFLQVEYDGKFHCPEWIRPQFGVFSRIPFNGKRSVTQTTIGFWASVDF